MSSSPEMISLLPSAWLVFWHMCHFGIWLPVEFFGLFSGTQLQGVFSFHNLKSLMLGVESNVLLPVPHTSTPLERVGPISYLQRKTKRELPLKWFMQTMLKWSIEIVSFLACIVYQDAKMMTKSGIFSSNLLPHKVWIQKILPSHRAEDAHFPSDCLTVVANFKIV